MLWRLISAHFWHEIAVISGLAAPTVVSRFDDSRANDCSSVTFPNVCVQKLATSAKGTECVRRIEELPFTASADRTAGNRRIADRSWKGLERPHWPKIGNRVSSPAPLRLTLSPVGQEFGAKAVIGGCVTNGRNKSLTGRRFERQVGTSDL